MCAVLLKPSHVTDNYIAYGVESISIALQSNTSLTSLDISCVVLFKHLSHTTGNKIEYSGAQKVAIALQSNSSLTSLAISSVLCCLNTFHTQQVTILEILVLRAFREHSNQTLHSHHLLFPVCCAV